MEKSVYLIKSYCKISTGYECKGVQDSSIFWGLPTVIYTPNQVFNDIHEH